MNAVQSVTLSLTSPKDGVSLPAGPSSVQTQTRPGVVNHEELTEEVFEPGSNDNQASNIPEMPEQVVVGTESESEHDSHADQTLYHRGQQAEDNAENLEAIHKGTQGMASVQTAKMAKQLQVRRIHTQFKQRLTSS